MRNTPGLLIPLIITWSIFLVTGMSLIRQAITGKSSATRSGVHRVVNEIKFRLGFAAGVVLLILALSGMVWLLVNW